MEGGYTIQIVENTDQGKFCSPFVVSSFSITQGMFISTLHRDQFCDNDDVKYIVVVYLKISLEKPF